MREKAKYVSPESDVLEFRLEGVIAASGPLFNDPFNPEIPWIL